MTVESKNNANNTVVITTYHYGKPLEVRKTTVMLTEHSYDDFIQKAHSTFAPLRLTGLVSPKTKKIDDLLDQMIREGDSTYFPPALTGHYLAEKTWEEVNVMDGAFMLDNHAWVTPEQWYSLMPFMMEFLLRVDRWVDAKYEFFIYTLAGLDAKDAGGNYIRSSEREFLKSGKCNTKMVSCILEFLNHFEKKYKNDLGPSDFLLDEIQKAREWWQNNLLKKQLWK